LSIIIGVISGLFLMTSQLLATQYNADFRTQALDFLQAVTVGSLYPVFLLVWINRRAIKDEMALWGKSA
jgi:membrane protein CcdC involved in cytochrome C biogenesis